MFFCSIAYAVLMTQNKDTTTTTTTNFIFPRACKKYLQFNREIIGVLAEITLELKMPDSQSIGKIFYMLRSGTQTDIDTHAKIGINRVQLTTSKLTIFPTEYLLN